jgi:hypothetical protein
MTLRPLATRTLRHPLSRAQLDVLAKLELEGPCPTSTSTMGRYVAGTATAALERRGLVKMRGEDFGGDGEWTFEITDAGKRALDESRAT